MPQDAAYTFDGTGDVIADVSGNGNHFSIAGTGATRIAGVHNEGLRYAGGSLPVLPDVGRTPQRSLSGWLKFVAPPSCWPIIFNVPSIDSGAWGILMFGGNVNFQARSASAGPVRAAKPWPADGTPHFVAGTFDGSAVRISLDGGAFTAAPLAGPIRTDTDPPRLFLDCGAMNGFLDDLRIHDHALSLAEIAALMAAPAGPEVSASRAAMMAMF
jgi:hypothetical protein